MAVLKAAHDNVQPEEKQAEADMIQNFIDQTAMKRFDPAQETLTAARATLAGR